MEWEAQTGTCHWLTSTVNNWGCTALDMLEVMGNDQAHTLVDKATITSGLLLGRFEVLRSLRHYLQAQSQEHHTIDCLEERSVERGSTI